MPVVFRLKSSALQKEVPHLSATLGLPRNELVACVEVVGILLLTEGRKMLPEAKYEFWFSASTR